MTNQTVLAVGKSYSESHVIKIDFPLPDYPAAVRMSL